MSPISKPITVLTWYLLGTGISAIVLFTPLIAESKQRVEPAIGKMAFIGLILLIVSAIVQHWQYKKRRMSDRASIAHMLLTTYAICLFWFDFPSLCDGGRNVALSFLLVYPIAVHALASFLTKQWLAAAGSFVLTLAAITAIVHNTDSLFVRVRNFIWY